MLERKPTLLIDNREKRPLDFNFIKQHGWDVKEQALHIGDISCEGLINSCTFERKSAVDLVMCCCSKEHARFQKEIITLRGFKCKNIVVEADYEQIEKGLDDNGKPWRSQATPEVVLKVVHTFEIRYDVQFVFMKDREASARYIFRKMNRYYELCKDWVKLFQI
jgi:ERCC4-type nuclease